MTWRKEIFIIKYMNNNMVLQFFLLSSTIIIYQYEKLVLLRLGKLQKKQKAIGPGIVIFLPCIDRVKKVTLRTEIFNVAEQEILTKDSCTIMVDALIYYYVEEPINAIMQVENYRVATGLLAATTLRTVVGHKYLTQVLSERNEIAVVIKEILDKATSPWGVCVERVEILEMQLPLHLQRAMAAEAEATREARAKVIAAEGERKAATNLKEASDVMQTNSTSLQLRYLQTMNTISMEKNSTILFPLPVNFIA